MAWSVPAIRAPRLRLPRPKKFLGFIPLQMGTQLISLTLLFNKLTGFYGLLAILTGFSLSATQLSAYLYNVLILITVAFCFPHIQRETPLPNLVLAWTYVVDTLANAAYTAVFAASWYLAASAAATTATPVSGAAAATISAETATATVTAETQSIPQTYVIATPTMLRRDGDLSVSETAAAAAAAAATASTTVSATASATATATAVSETAGSGGWMGAHETAASLTLIVIVTVVRIYFSLVVMAHTRRALQRYSEHVATQSIATAAAGDDSSASDVEEEKVEKDKGKEVDDEGSGSGAGSNDADTEGDPDKPDMDDEEVGLKSGTRLSKSRRGGRHAGRSRRRYRPAAAAAAITTANNAGSDANPFAAGSPAGDGWQGRIGRALVRVGRGYWLERGPDDDLSRSFRSRFRTPLPV